VFFVEARYHRSPERAAGQVRYIAHREEGLTDGRRRELYAIGERYRSFRGDERVIRQALREGACGRGILRRLRRATFRLASKVMPRSIREVLRLLRGARVVGLRQR